MQSEERLRRIEQATDLPLLVLAVALIPLLAGPLFFEVSGSLESAFLAADWLIWAAFAVDFGAKLVVAPRRLAYARSHWLEAAMVFLPFLRPFRALRLLRFARLLTVAGFNVSIIRELASKRGTKFIVAAVLTILVAGAGLTLLAERSEDGSNIRTFGDALWWSVTTMTTVGYGDLYPTTAAGRGIATALMLFGIASLSVLTASIAALLVREREDVTLQDIMSKLDSLERELAALRDSRSREGGND